MSKENIYTITEETYEATVNERILLYAFIRQMVFLTKRAETLEDFFHLKEAAAIFGAQAETLFETWDIPSRYLVYGDPGDLDALREKELLDYGEDDGDDLTEDDLTEDDFPDDNGEDFEGEDFEGEAFLDLLADMAGKARFVSEVLDTLLEISGGQPDSAASEHE